MLLAVFAILLTLILVVGIHEAGHALAARIFSVTIERIAIGFGKPLFQWRRSTNGPEWVLGTWPLGGYVHLANTRIHQIESKKQISYFDKKPIWQRILIILAGALANVFIAWIAFVFVFYLGLNYTIPQIQTVAPSSVSAAAGMSNGDRFVAIAGRHTYSWQEVGKELVIFWGKPQVHVTLAQANSSALKEVDLDLSHVAFSSHDKSLLASIGIDPNLAASQEMMRADSFRAALHEANTTLIHLVYFFMIMLKQIITRVIPFSILLGPIGLFSLSITSLMQGFVTFLYFIANLSMAVAVVNMLPIPGLDGGAIVYTCIEKIRGQPLSIALEVLIYRFMLIISGLVLIQLILNDFSRFFL